MSSFSETASNAAAFVHGIARRYVPTSKRTTNPTKTEYPSCQKLDLNIYKPIIYSDSNSWSSSSFNSGSSDSTSTPSSNQSNLSSTSELSIVTETLTLSGKYDVIVGNDKEKFIAEWNQKYRSECLDVKKGSIEVTHRGTPFEIRAVERLIITEGGVELSSFGLMAATISESNSSSSDNTDSLSDTSTATTSSSSEGEKDKQRVKRLRKFPIKDRTFGMLVRKNQKTQAMGAKNKHDEAFSASTQTSTQTSSSVKSKTEEIIDEMKEIQQRIYDSQSAQEKRELRKKLQTKRDEFAKRSDIKLDSKNRLLAHFRYRDVSQRCPICGSGSGDIMQESFKVWAHKQILEFSLNAKASRTQVPKYYGFELYNRWREQQKP